MVFALNFTKGHGTGNDFVLYTDPDSHNPLTSNQIAAVCDRHYGVGADGVIRAVKSCNLPEGKLALAEDENAEWFMDYHNADGSVAEMCGNGIRVFVAYLLANDLAELNDGDTLVIATRAGLRDVQRNRNGFQVDLGHWYVTDTETRVRTQNEKTSRPGMGINMGNPHIVVSLPTNEELDAVDLSEQPHLDPIPVEGANVEFVVPQKPFITNGVGHIRMRVRERGSGETFSCGTGAAAGALAMRLWAGSQAPHHWRVDVPGGTLGVRMFPTQDGEHVGLSGPAVFVFTGEFVFDEKMNEKMNEKKSLQSRDNV